LQSSADQRDIVRVLVVESKNKMRAITEAKLVDSEDQLGKLLDSFTDLVKDRGATRRALKSVVRQGSAGALEPLSLPHEPVESLP